MTARLEEAKRLLDRRVGGYRILEVLGVGATAAVYRAKSAMGELVALKVSRPHLIDNRRSTARFLREVQAIERINHPGCVQIIDWGIDDDRLYIAMELVEAHDLAAVMRKQGRLPLRRAVSITMRVTEILIAAHSIGVVHRDLKPQNIKLLPPDENGEDHVKLLDFGLAKLFRRFEDAEETMPETLTAPGATVGTPNYMAPEQFRRGKTDHRADIYAVGVILYRMISDELPITGSNAIEVLVNLSSKDPVPIRKHLPHIHPLLESVITRCLAKDPEDRFQDAVALSEALDAVLENFEEIEPTTVIRPSHDALETGADDFGRSVGPSPDDEGPAPETGPIGETMSEVVTLPKAYAPEESLTGSTEVWSRRKRGPSSDTVDAPTKVMRSPSAEAPSGETQPMAKMAEDDEPPTRERRGDLEPTLVQGPGADDAVVQEGDAPAVGTPSRRRGALLVGLLLVVLVAVVVLLTRG